MMPPVRRELCMTFPERIREGVGTLAAFVFVVGFLVCFRVSVSISGCFVPRGHFDCQLGCYQHLVGRGPGCFFTPFCAQDITLPAPDIIHAELPACTSFRTVTLRFPLYPLSMSQPL